MGVESVCRVTDWPDSQPIVQTLEYRIAKRKSVYDDRVYWASGGGCAELRARVTACGDGLLGTEYRCRQLELQVRCSPEEIFGSPSRREWKMKTLYQMGENELERLHERLTRSSETSGAEFDALAAEVSSIIETERRSGFESVPPVGGSKAELIATARAMVGDELARRVDDRDLAAVLQRKMEAEDAKSARERGLIVSPYHVWTWLGDAKVWMEVAVDLDRGSRGPDSDIRDHYKSNVAHVATGLAFELTYKGLLVGEFEPFLQKHSCQSIHERLGSETQARLETIMTENGWPDATSCVRYLDERMSNADRKYWMVNPDRVRRTGVSEGTGFIVADGPMAIARLGQVLFRVLPLAIGKVRRAQRAWDYRERTQRTVS